MIQTKCQSVEEFINQRNSDIKNEINEMLIDGYRPEFIYRKLARKYALSPDYIKQIRFNNIKKSD